MRTTSIITVLLAGLATLLPAHAQEECTATIGIDLTSQVDSVAAYPHRNIRVLHYKVMVSTDGRRAEVTYNLLLTVTNAAGESRVVMRSRTVGIGRGAVYDIVHHSLEPGEHLASTAAELVSCRSLT